MADMPGMAKPEIQALPQIADRMTFIYLASHSLSIPRTRGGDPYKRYQALKSIDFSPHTRG